MNMNTKEKALILNAIYMNLQDEIYSFDSHKPYLREKERHNKTYKAYRKLGIFWGAFDLADKREDFLIYKG